MPIKDLLGKSSNKIEEDELLELSEELGEREAKAVPIKIVHLEDYKDAESVQRSVREGKIVFVKIKTLKEKDMGDLKRAIERIRKTCTAVDGDIAGVDEHYIVVVPSYARILRNDGEQE
ncbi:MAG: cell division protein SepF [Candidatus Aenigmatarchaeota archaeon]